MMRMEPQAIIARQFPVIVIPYIEQAQRSIRVIVFDWRWYPSIEGSSVSRFNAAIAAAARRGVLVRALVNNDAVAARLRQVGCEAKRLHSTKLLHTKMLVIDDTRVVIGSHNYTQHAFELNEEVSIAAIIPDPQNEFVQYFDNLWAL